MTTPEDKMTKSGGYQEEQFTNYDPLGLAISKIGGDNPYLYNGKELYSDFSDAYEGVYDFGARYYNPLYGRWFAPDPEKQHPNPYIYCGNNPVMLLDPDGRKFYEWTFRHLVMTLQMAKNYILNDEDYIKSFNIVFNKDQFEEDQYNKAKKKYDDYRNRLKLIEQDEKNLQRMHEDEDHLYILKKVNEEASYVLEGKDNKVLIQYSSDGVLAHERLHIIQWLDMGGEFQFEDGKLLNAGYFASKGQQIEQQTLNEVNAYKMQYAYDGAFVLPGISGDININNMNDITPNTISNIFNRGTGKPAYPYAATYR